MADVTISQLPNTTPSLGSIIPVSLGGTTYSTVLQQLSSLPFIPKAFGGFNCYSLAKLGDGFNFKDVTRISTGNYFVNFNTPMNSADYTVTISSNTAGTVGGIASYSTLGNYPDNTGSYYSPTQTNGFYCQSGKYGLGGPNYGYETSSNGGYPKIYFAVYSAL